LGEGCVGVTCIGLIQLHSQIADVGGNHSRCSGRCCANARDEAQRLLKKQLDDQLTALDNQEENLLDLAADGTVASGKIKGRLFKLQRERERLTTQRDAVTLDLTPGPATSTRS